MLRSMGGRSLAHKQIVKEELETTPEDEMDDQATRKVKEGNGELLVNIPSEWHGFMGLEKGTTIRMRFFGSGFVATVQKTEGADGDE